MKIQLAMSTADPQFEQTLFIEKLARSLKFDTMAETIPGPDIYPPYLFLGVFLLIDLGIVNTYSHFTGHPHVFIASPTAIAAPLGLVLAAVGIRYMSDGYADAISDLHVQDRVRESELTMFRRLVSYRLKIGVYGVAVVVLYINNLINVGVSSIVAVGGDFALINWLVIWPVAYLPFVVEFALIYFGIHALIPRRISRADLGLFFYDPRNMGGFGPLGQFLKRSYYLYTIGLLLYLVLVYGPVITAIGQTPKEPGLFLNLFFSIAWLVGVISIGYSMLKIHRIMSEKKEERIRELEEELREIIENPYDINSSEVADRDRFEDVSRRLENVRETREFPATFTMWSQIAIGVILPQALQVAIQLFQDIG